MWLAERRGRHAEAIEHAQHAQAAYRQAGHRSGQARALNAIGWCSGKLGDHRSAAQHCRRALVIHREVDDRLGEAGAWDSTGYAHHQLGQHGKAVRCALASLDNLAHPDAQKIRARLDTLADNTLVQPSAQAYTSATA